MKIVSKLHRSLVVAITGAVALATPSLAQATPTITAVTPATVAIGQATTISGTVDSLAPGEAVHVEQQLDGAWSRVGIAAVTTTGGAWSVAFRPTRGGDVRAVQSTGTLGMSAPAAISVAPKVLSARLTGGTVYPFLGTTAVWKIAPATWSGKVRVNISIDGRAAGWTTGRARNGVATVRVPTNGTGRFRFQLVLPKGRGFAQVGDKRLQFAVRGRRIGSGASGMWVRSLRAGLKFRGIYTTSSGGFDSRFGDTVIAFHKAYGRSRTTTFELSDWSLLTHKRITVRYPRAGSHIEIDKGRQILMQVKDGKAWAVIHISSGRTGNTPTGRHRINWKGNWVPSLYDSLLYKSMSFQGAYAIHGYPSVPTTAASHGCVRVPMWIAAWLYANSPVGEYVYVYEGPGSTHSSVGRARGADVPELSGVDATKWADER